MKLQIVILLIVLYTSLVFSETQSCKYQSRNVRKLKAFINLLIRFFKGATTEFYGADRGDCTYYYKCKEGKEVEKGYCWFTKFSNKQQACVFEDINCRFQPDF